ncbi:rRNA maturation RNase YbeY [Flagellimonas halotolerans]|uniref:Endoribonuclease YbeY n=1 Tax=Flagellimonas halotolerans TaxID=3112164 RepID=A0ABU6IL30_9FLAO|nr:MULTISPECIES: rRNA maturation RNase YbeY [unclassified Allomuricauda]MEC3963942.1 rRNA maturation RNase YbeY [Muricauda sp. SYSU M86414]MEC4263812.1 rRNA maturation RNase YbeY [Muricauda sp. SYSU M84420]
MIEFHFKSEFVFHNRSKYADWINRIIVSEGFVVGQIDYIFCTDDYLLQLNKEYLNHDTFTDIITFDYKDGKTLSGDIFISTDRVRENAAKFDVGFLNELRRVMSHGILHLAGFGDKTKEEKLIMREKEEEKIKMFHVEP